MFCKVHLDFELLLSFYCRQNDQSFRERTGALRKVLKKYADLGKNEI